LFPIYPDILALLHLIVFDSIAYREAKKSHFSGYYGKSKKNQVFGIIFAYRFRHGAATGNLAFPQDGSSSPPPCPQKPIPHVPAARQYARSG
jgi:hypothetical protein